MPTVVNTSNDTLPYHLDPAMMKYKRRAVRVFKQQESLTNQLVATDYHFQAIYDVAMIQVLIFNLYVLIRDSYKAGRLYFDTGMLFKGLGTQAQFSTFLFLECGLISSAFAVYPAFLAWRCIYCLMAAPALRWLVSATFVLGYSLLVLLSAIIVCWIIFVLPLPPLLTVIASIEQLRLSMKSYSFIRENAYKIIYPWSKDDDSGPAHWYAGQMHPKPGTFSQYLYFLIAPTMLYRDYYPRNQGPIRWRYVSVYFLQFLTTIWYMSVVYRDFTFPKAFSSQELLNCYLSCLLSAFFMLILIHTCVLHSYLNLVSELTRFADRDFYQDWWTCTSFSSYYRKWNTLIHDWIRAYIYQDFKTLFSNGVLAVFVTTFVSSLIHEYLLSIALGFASPMLMIEFAGLGAVFYVMKPLNIRRLSNFFVLLALSVGGANLLFYYQVEYAARIYCPQKLTVYNFFKPRMFDCYWQQMSNSTT